jgi:Fe-S oxidoreductase
MREVHRLELQLDAAKTALHSLRGDLETAYSRSFLTCWKCGKKQQVKTTILIEYSCEDDSHWLCHCCRAMTTTRPHFIAYMDIWKNRAKNFGEGLRKEYGKK